MCMQKDKVWLECNHRAFFRFEPCARLGHGCFGAGGDHDEVHVQDICADCKRKDPNPAAREAERVRREMELRARRAEEERVAQIKRLQIEARRRAEDAKRKQEEEALKLARRRERERRQLEKQADNKAAKALESYKRKHEGGEEDEPKAKRQRGRGGGG